MPEDSFKEVTRRGYLGTAGLLLAGAGGTWAAQRAAADREIPRDIDLPDVPVTIRDEDPEEVPDIPEFEDVDEYIAAVEDTLEARQKQFAVLQENTVKRSKYIPDIKKDDPAVTVDDTYVDSQYAVIEQDETVDDPEWIEHLNSDYATVANTGHPVLDLEEWEEQPLTLAVREDTTYREWHLDTLSRIFRDLSKAADTLQKQELQQEIVQDRDEPYDPSRVLGETSLDTLYQRTRAKCEEQEEGTDGYEKLSELRDEIDHKISELDGYETHYRDASEMLYYTKKRSFFEDGEDIEKDNSSAHL